MLVIGVAFLFVGAGAAMLAPHSSYLDSPASYFTADATNHNCQPGDEPCKFPTEAGVGGIILGTTDLAGEDLATWLSYDGDGTSGICHDAGTCIESELAPGRVDSTETTIGIGLNQIVTADFFAYKGWWDTHHATGEDFHTYFWMGAETAALRGTDNPSECGVVDGDMSYAYGQTKCDLTVEAGEVAVKEFEASGSTTLSISIDLEEDDYWLSYPEYDQCSVDIWDTSATCLGMLESGSDGQDKLDDVEVSMDGLFLRVHRGFALPDDGTSPPTTKELELNDVYLEIRHGKGSDTAVVPTNLNFPEVGQPISTGTGQDRVGRLGLDFACEGNPMGTGYEDCFVAAHRQDVTGASYEDIHR